MTVTSVSLAPIAARSPLIFGEEAYEVGWMVVPEFQGRGIAVAATTQAIELAKHRFMHAFPNVDNAPSNAMPQARL